MSKKSNSSKQVNMAALVAAEVAAAPLVPVVVSMSADSVVPDVSEKIVAPSAKEMVALRVIAKAKAFANGFMIAQIDGIEATSVAGIVASLNKKGYVIAEPSFMGTLYVATESGAEFAAMAD